MAVYQIAAYCFEHAGEIQRQCNGKAQADKIFDKLSGEVLHLLNTDVARIAMYTGKGSGVKRVKHVTVSHFK